MSNHKIIIAPNINREDGITRFDKEFTIDDVFSIVDVNDELELSAFCDSVFYWSSSAKTTTVTTSRGRVYEIQDHWKPLQKGSRMLLEKDPQGTCHFKFKRDTRFGKIVEFMAIIVKDN